MTENDKSARQLHDKATRGGTLTDAERARLGAWYEQQDAAEAARVGSWAEELDHRLAEYRRNSQEGVSWQKVQQRVRDVRGKIVTQRITIDPAICHGKPTIRGLRYPVEMLLELLSAGMSIDEILADYEDLEREDILAALAYAARLT